MKDSEGIQLLQWCLPRLHLRWPGFRKVRRQVYKRIDRRLKELELSGPDEYQAYLDTHPAEWKILDELCWISISRFYRDKGVFQFLEREVLTQIAQAVSAKGEQEVRGWSIGCASGEEPYTLAILWKLVLAPRWPSLCLRILATDADPRAIERAQRGCYPASSLKELPGDLLAKACIPSADGFCVKPEYRQPVNFLLQDVRQSAPEDRFHLILCRNLAFTYFDDELQRATLQKISDRLLPEGALVLGSLESLPEGAAGWEPWSKKSGIYRRSPVIPAP